MITLCPGFSIFRTASAACQAKNKLNDARHNLTHWRAQTIVPSFVTLGCLEIKAEKKPNHLIRIMPAEGVVTGRLQQTLQPPQHLVHYFGGYTCQSTRAASPPPQ